MHQLPFRAAISDAVFAYLKSAAERGRDQKSPMIPEIRLVECCGDALASLSAGSTDRLSFRPEPANRVAAYSARPVPKVEWAILLFERKFAHNVFVIEDLEVEIGEAAQAALKGKVLDLIDGKMAAIPFT